jgi:hypothetical protein
MSIYSDPFYDPYYAYNGFGAYAFTPSWVYSYNDFYNPFWGGSQMCVINGPFSSCWNTGFYNPYSWNYYSPTCATIIYNNAYPYYSGYYDYNRRNVVYAPRTSGYGNSYRTGYNNTNNSNRGSGYQNNTNIQAPAKRYQNTNQNTPRQNNNVYRYNQPANNNGNNTQREAPVPNNNNIGNQNNNSDNGGIRIGTRPK